LANLKLRLIAQIRRNRENSPRVTRRWEISPPRISFHSAFHPRLRASTREP